MNEYAPQFSISLSLPSPCLSPYNNKVHERLVEIFWLSALIFSFISSAKKAFKFKHFSSGSVPRSSSSSSEKITTFSWNGTCEKNFLLYLSSASSFRLVEFL